MIMQDPENRDSESGDWSWVRYQRLRWEFVDAVLLSVVNHEGTRDLSCNEGHCCLPMVRMFPYLGVSPSDGFRGSSRLSYLEEHLDEVSESMRDGMDIVSTFIDHPRPHPLDGYMEAPFAVVEVINSDYFSYRYTESSDRPHVKDEPSRELKETLFAFVHLAFPDKFLDRVRRKPIHSLSGTRMTTNPPIHRDEFEKHFESSRFSIPEITDEMLSSLRRSSRGFASGVWSDLTPYDLSLIPSDDPLSDGESSRYAYDIGLDYFHDRFPSVWQCFDYSEYANEGGVGMCFIARTDSLFVNQQCWEFGGINSELWNRCTDAFNQFLAPHLEEFDNQGRVFVVYSSFRDAAFIVSRVEQSWDSYAPLRSVLAPLPEGYGVVGVWKNFEEDRYIPRDLDDIVAANYSGVITAAARYLKACLHAERGDRID